MVAGCPNPGPGSSSLVPDCVVRGFAPSRGLRRPEPPKDRYFVSCRTSIPRVLSATYTYFPCQYGAHALASAGR